MVIRYSVKQLLAKNSVTRPMEYIVAEKYHLQDPQLKRVLLARNLSC